MEKIVALKINLDDVVADDLNEDGVEYHEVIIAVERRRQSTTSSLLQKQSKVMMTNKISTHLTQQKQKLSSSPPLRDLLTRTLQCFKMM